MPSETESRAKLFFDFLSSFEQKISRTSHKKYRVPRTLERDFPGLFELFQTLTSASVLEHKATLPTEEWNPFSQRMFFRGKNYFSNLHLMGDFEFISTAIDRFIEAAHEAAHIMILEPYFCGRAKFENVNQFIKANFNMEAFCFWYADIVVTKRLRVRFPDGELVRSRSAASQQLFHPYRAFLALGIKDEKKILEFYLKAFNGSTITGKSTEKSLYVSNLSSRLLSVYGFHSKSNLILFDVLHKIGIFDTFQKRFCSDRRLPSIFSEAVLRKSDITERPEKYCIKIARQGFTDLQKRNQHDLKRVELRRHIQMRAYYGTCLRYALEHKLVFSLTGKNYNPDTLLSSATHYLDQLENCIQMLAEGKSIRKLSLACKKADQFYTQNLHLPSKRCSLWIARRVGIFPKFDTKGNMLGLLNAHEKIDRKDTGAINEILLKYFTSKSINRKEMNSSTLVKIGRMIELCPAGTRYPSRNQIQWRQLYQEVILEPEILRLWSIPLAALNPEQNKFRELLFMYE